jgi:phage head maturation protease
VSVGFIPLRWEDGSKGAEPGPAPRRRYLEQELLEVSAVAIPANPDALALGLKSGAVAKSDLQETVELLRALVGAQGPNPQLNPLINLARELRRVMQKA